MKLLKKILYSFIFLIALAMTGCATNQEKYFLSSNNITVERVDSNKARVQMVNVTEANEGIEISGMIRQRSITHAAIPGHMDIELIGDRGQAISKSKTKYIRKNHKAKTARFKLKLDDVPKENYIVRVTHHYSTYNSLFCCHSTDVEK